MTTKRRLIFTIPGPPIGAVRQTQSDRWKKRPCVLAYRDWCDLARKCATNVPPPECIDELWITAYYVPPESWSKKKRAAAIGKRKRTKPDWDNIGKALCDALWKQDEGLGDAHVRRMWAWEPRLEVVVIYRS